MKSKKNILSSPKLGCWREVFVLVVLEMYQFFTWKNSCLVMKILGWYIKMTNLESSF